MFYIGLIIITITIFLALTILVINKKQLIKIDITQNKIIKKILWGIIITLTILFTLLEIIGFIHYIDVFIHGLHISDVLGNYTGITYYGLKAILKDGWAHIFYVPCINIASILQLIILWKNIGKTHKQTTIIITVITIIINILFLCGLFSELII